MTMMTIMTNNQFSPHLWRSEGAIFGETIDFFYNVCYNGSIGSNLTTFLAKPLAGLYKM